MEKVQDGISVLSLFDGISCGRLALDRAGIAVKSYYASEIDKRCINLTARNWPNTIHLGDVREIKKEDLPKIDLVLGGSPCQGFSKAGLLKGFDDPRSALFFKFVEILGWVKDANKNAKFLFENVINKRIESEITKELKVSPIKINSALLSAQHRERMYWTDITPISPIKDNNSSFQDIKESGDHLLKYKLKRTPMREIMWGDGDLKKVDSRKCKNVTNAEKIRCIAGRQDRRHNAGLVECEDFCRLLSQKELELCQTLPAGYTKHMSYSAACVAIGNGWTVDVIAHILRHYPPQLKKPEQT